MHKDQTILKSIGLSGVAFHLWAVSFWYVYKSTKSINQQKSSNSIQSIQINQTNQIWLYFQWIKQINIWPYICKGSSVSRTKPQSHKATMPQHMFPCLSLSFYFPSHSHFHLCMYVCVLHLHNIGSCHVSVLPQLHERHKKIYAQSFMPKDINELT